MQEKIKELLKLGREAVSLSKKSKKNEPYLSLIWQNNGLIIGDFYSSCLTLEDNSKHHKFSAYNEGTLETILDHYVMLAKREVVLLSREDDEIGNVCKIPKEKSLK